MERARHRAKRSGGMVAQSLGNGVVRISMGWRAVPLGVVSRARVRFTEAREGTRLPRAVRSGAGGLIMANGAHG